MKKYICTTCKTIFNMHTPDMHCPQCGGLLVVNIVDMLHAAEQQLFGFVAHIKGDSIVDLVDAMGLTQEEWDKLRDGEASYIPEELKQTVDDYFTTKGEVEV